MDEKILPQHADDERAFDANQREEVTKLGSHLTYLAARRVVYLLTIMSIAVPFASDDLSYEMQSAAFSFMVQAASSESATLVHLGEFVDLTVALPDVHPVFVRLNGTTFLPGNFNALRCDARVTLVTSDEVAVDVQSATNGGVFSIATTLERQAIFNIVFVLMSL